MNYTFNSGLTITIFIFPANGVPHGYTATQLQGFVEELLVDDDPEYQVFIVVFFVKSIIEHQLNGEKLPT